MTDDIIVVVPPGTRVRYVENRHAEGVYVIDAHLLMTSQIPNPLMGLPVYDAKRYTHG